MGGSLAVGIVALGMLGGSPDAPAREPTELTFDLPDPRPSGMMTIEVAPLTVIDLTRRRIRVSAMAEAVSPRRVVGEDGLMGGIPFR